LHVNHKSITILQKPAKQPHQTKWCIDFGLFWPVSSSVNNDKQILVFFNVHNALVTVTPSHVCGCVRFDVTAIAGWRFQFRFRGCGNPNPSTIGDTGMDRVP
jgi:hypothetical protein